MLVFGFDFLPILHCWQIISVNNMQLVEIGIVGSNIVCMMVAIRIFPLS